MIVTKEEIMSLVKNKEIGKIVDLAKSVDLCPICIPSYKFREHAYLLRNFQFASRTIVFVYDDDFSVSGYDKFPFPKNVEFVKITKKDFEDNGLKWRGLRPKRVFMQKWLKEHGINKYFMIDDDVDPSKCNIVKGPRNNKCGSNYTERIPIELFCKVIQLIGDAWPEYKLLGARTVFGPQFFKYDKIFSENRLVAQLYFFNDFPLTVTTDDSVLEDIELFLRCLKEGIKFGCIEFINAPSLDVPSESIAGTEDRHAKTYLLAPNFLNFKISKQNTLHCIIDYRKVKKNNQTFDSTLVRYCKEKNFDAIKEYLKND